MRKKTTVAMDEYDRRVARILSLEGYFLRRHADTVMEDGARWGRDHPLYKESRLTFHLMLSAATMTDALAEKIIRKGLPKRERELLCKFLADPAAKAAGGE